MIRQLQPWFENISKRQVRSPKIYLRDSGLFHHLHGIDTMETLQSHPKLGASGEGFALETYLQLCTPREAYLWSTYSGAELDLFYVHQGKRYGVEMKFSSEPRMNKSMEQARTTLDLDHLWILMPGTKSWELNAWISVIGLEELPNHPHAL